MARVGPLSVHTDLEADAIVVHAVGDVDMGTAPLLDTELTAACDTAAPQVPVVADLTGVSFLDSTGLRVLVAAHKRGEDRRNPLRIVATTQAVLRTLRITGLTRELDVVGSRSEAAPRPGLSTVALHADPPQATEDPDPLPPAHPRGAGWLVVTRGARAGERFVLSTERTNLGRDRGCDVVLDDVTVSRGHASIGYGPAGYTLVDSGSLNGTYVNRSAIETETPLCEGDEIWIGTFRLTFHAS